jgi:ribosomal protein S18 acetylase RimI-like enzyme
VEVIMEYKKILLEDIKMVLNMEGDFRDNFLQEEYVKRFLKNPMNWLFVCISKDRIIGFAYGYELNKLNTLENMLYIHEVGVLPEFQRKGIGTELLKELKNVCKKNGIYKIFLFTQKSNIGACKLYEKSGGELAWDSKDDDRTYFFNVK